MAIQAHNITKSFGRFLALDAVNLDVADGELVALLGPSGSGKTTLLRIIAGLEQADPEHEAAVLFDGIDVTRSNASQRQVGFVFQHYALFRHMTVFENIAFGLRVRKRRFRPNKAEIRDKVRRLLQLIQLENMEGRYPSQLSGGQRQRVALARALAVEPKVLLLDEPFGALDAKVRKELRQWLRRLHDEISVTSVFVTHDQEEALEVADRVVVMNQGRIEQIGAPDEVFHRPATAFVIDFLGDVNLFHGRVESGHAVFGSLTMPHEEAATVEGKSARLFVRPYDLEVHKEEQPGRSIGAKLLRVLTAGPIVRLELQDDSGATFFAEASHERYRTAQWRTGDRVHVTIRDARLFVDDTPASNGHTEVALEVEH